LNLFLYVDRGTWIHRLDPRTKLASAMAFTCVCLCFNHPAWTAGVAAGIAAVGVGCGATLNFWRLRYVLFLLFAFSVLMWPFFVRGETLWWSWGPLALTREAILYGLAMGLRLVTFVCLGLVFLSTTRNEELTNGLIRLGLPYPLAFAVSMALRLVPTFVGVGATIIEAQMSRGLDLKEGNILRRLGQFIPQAVPLFIYAIHQTNQLAMALESRGFDPGAPRTFYYGLRMGGRDWAMLGLITGLLAASLYLRLGFGLGVVIPGRL
jgi:energy-coupling factor transport system permease protein